VTEAVLIVYLVGLCYFAGITVHGLDELHALRDDKGIGQEIVAVLGRRWGHVWIDLIGTLSLVLWPLLVVAGVYSLIRRR
jgi:hypothetical protein